MKSTDKAQEAGAANDVLTIRRAGPGDRRPLVRLAGRDSRPLPRGEVLVADLDGELLAARSLTDGLAIADPFRPTAEIAELLARRSKALVAARADEQRRRERTRSALGHEVGAAAAMPDPRYVRPYDAGALR